MTFEEAKEIKTKEVTKGSYKCFDDLLHTHSHKGWLFQVMEEAANLFATAKAAQAWEEGYEAMKDQVNDEYSLVETAFVTGYAEAILERNSSIDKTHKYANNEPAYHVAKEAEKWMMEAERLKSELLHRDINVLPEKDAEIERLIIDLKAHKEIVAKQEKEILTFNKLRLI